MRLETQMRLLGQLSEDFLRIFALTHRTNHTSKLFLNLIHLILSFFYTFLHRCAQRCHFFEKVWQGFPQEKQLLASVCHVPFISLPKVFLNDIIYLPLLLIYIYRVFTFSNYHIREIFLLSPNKKKNKFSYILS